MSSKTDDYNALVNIIERIIRATSDPHEKEGLDNFVFFFFLNRNKKTPKQVFFLLSMKLSCQKLIFCSC